MKKLATLALILPLCALAADAPKQESLINDISVSPYYTVTFADFNGKATSGVGLDVGLGLSKTITAVSFIETSDTKDGAWVDRFGAGLQMQGKLGKWLKPYGRFSVCYALDDFSSLQHDKIFVRPEFGADIDVYHYRNTSVSFRGAWLLNVDTEGHAAQGLKAGLNFKF